MSRVHALIGRPRRAVLAVIVSALVLAAALAPGTGGGRALSLPPLPTSDLQNLLALPGTQTPARAPVQESATPAIAAVPRAVCGPGSRPLAGEQGRVPASAINSPAAADGWTCNLRAVGHYATPGGFRVWRYADTAGHVCAYYDTSL